METSSVSLNDTEWTLLSTNRHTIVFDIVEAKAVLVHLNDGATPALGAPSFRVLSHPPEWDFSISGLSSSQSVWAKAEKGQVNLVVGLI